MLITEWPQHGEAARCSEALYHCLFRRLGKHLIKPADAVAALPTNTATSPSPGEPISPECFSKDFAEMFNAFMHDLINCFSNYIRGT